MKMQEQQLAHDYFTKKKIHVQLWMLKISWNEKPQKLYHSKKM
jgi:hypothetical protein